MARALTKRHGTGKPYTRPREIEAKIDAALAQDVATLHRKARVTDRGSPDYLESECLVHLVRDARRREDEAAMDALFPILLGRCETNLRANLPLRALPDATDLHEEALGRFAELFATDGTGDNPDQLDYFECKFNSAFRTIRIDVFRSESSRLKHITPLPTMSDERGEEAEEDVWARVSDAFRCAAMQEDATFRNELRTAINALPPDERKAVVLCHFLGYKVESNNPDEHTAATRCGVSGRTISSRLRRAAAKLERFKKEV